MSFKTLGLDLGIASIGWAYISETQTDVELNGWGSRIFDPGQDDDIESGKGVSRCAVRRTKRALRIQYKRRRMHKEELTAILMREKMLPNPLTPDFFTRIDGVLLNQFPVDSRSQIGHVLPYLYRKKALDKPLSREELGRALYHLAQRRGYLSNRKQDLKNSDSGVVKEAIRDLRSKMEESKARTLGEYFCTLNPEETRIRGQYTDRSMYEDEFHKICAAQRALISEDLEKELYHAIFFQRPLKSCKGLIGKCRMYPEEPRCSFLYEEAQLFRIYTTAIHLRIEKGGYIRSLSDEEFSKTIEILNGFSDIFTIRGTVALSKLGKMLPLGKGEKFTLADEEKEIYGNVLHCILFRVFGERAAQISTEEQQKFFHDLQSIEKEDVLRKRLNGYWHLSALQAENAMKAALPDTYCAFSRKALLEILPDLKARIALNTIEKVGHAPHCKIHEMLPVFDSDECNIELRNPVVHRVMTELRTVVNAVIKRYGKPNAIRIELARSLKSTNKERERYTQQIREREKERSAIAEKILKEAGLAKPSRNDILKVMLAEECNYCCPYTGKSFSMHDLLYGMNIHIEHIIPYSRSFDDSFRNKTLCEASANAAKNNNTPFEAFHGEEYAEILKRVEHFKGPFRDYKLDLFKQDKVDEQEFLERNLNDTRYASKLAMQYLAMLYGGIYDEKGHQRIFATSGGHTALIRRAWGGNYLLGEGEKVRSDHRHHAIDALTIAMTTPEMVKKIASMTPEERKRKHETMKPLIDGTLYFQAKEMLPAAAVSHHVVNKIRGAFHKETIYGKDYGNGERHVRVALADMTARDFDNILDGKIKQLILDRLEKTETEKLVDADFKIFKEEKNLPKLLDKNGNAVNTIKFVRVTQTVRARQIGEGDARRFVANGANHVLVVYSVLDETGNETGWDGEVISLLDARQKQQRHLPMFEKEKPGRKFKFTLQKGDVVRWEKDGKLQLCIIRGISLPQFYLAPITDARMKKEMQAAHVWFTPTLSAAYNGKMEKFNMNLFGELQTAND